MNALRSPASASPKNNQFFFWKAFHKKKNWIHVGIQELGHESLPSFRSSRHVAA
jgi:hypothetical protein